MVKIANIELGEFPLLLAPMEDVSDPPFRALCKKHGADMMYTEFISSEGLIRDAAKSIQKLDIYEDERPVGIQIFGGDEDAMRESAEIVTRTNPDVIDINYGCPVKKVVCKDAGAGILRDIPKMIRLTKAVIESTHLPVTVKTRLGWDDNTKYIVDVAERLQDIGVQAISIHGRTRVQMYKGEADWSLIGEVKNNQRMHIPVFGNGDINTPQKALEMRERYGVDGVMIGRAAIGYPWVFNEIKHFMKTGQIKDLPTIEERAALAKEHLERAIKWKGEKLGVVETRRHYTNYFKGIPHFKETRTRLVTIDDPQELFAILDGVKNEFAGVEIGL
ncbi:MAG: tRNA dihydrouridine synthase DusB [Salibacteraceae bacterium]|jgi:tRNA-dihydrouridine synthase B|nr:tRNA dihydrouridine synthase DusB [Salibacteraceae bacterium]MDP4844563.1 tRNA dihydrouridine synthase DusB [Salibacteraceae bacterium]MDP4934078.1 tRNA dihydrouridine synthase DusB [Salibacteraceae bacterium]MDP4965981.1 tRNA dihydrouridine synthase DusB [Salibacteraceae bacterium]